MSDAIDFNRVSKRFGDTTALNSVSFGVPAGCIYGLIGLNGAGKTTLIKCLLDFTFPDSGEIRIFRVPAADSRARGPLAYLPERFIPPSYLTGLEYLQMMSRLYGAAPQPARIEAAVAAIDLDPMSGLDPRARTFLKTEIKAAHARGATVLFSSHSLADIEELCDSFTLLHQGEIRYIGGAKELCARTGASTLDAAFLKAIEGPVPQEPA